MWISNKVANITLSGKRVIFDSKQLLQFCASTCSAITDQARLANLGYLNMRQLRASHFLPQLYIVVIETLLLLPSILGLEASTCDNSIPYNYRAYKYSISHWPLFIYIYIYKALETLLKCPLNFSIRMTYYMIII